MMHLFSFMLAIVACCSLNPSQALAQNNNVAVPSIIPGANAPTDRAVPVLGSDGKIQDAQPVVSEPPAIQEATTIAVPLADEIAPSDVKESSGTPPAITVETKARAEALSNLSLAQDSILQGRISNDMSSLERLIADMISVRNPGIDITRTSSLFFTKEERDQMLEARRKSLIEEMKTDEMITGDPYSDAPGGKSGASRSGPREIVLGGISYQSKEHWTIWLNQMRITPSLIPKPVQNLRVYKDYIELEWLDVNTNQIYPVRLRPHQRFNIDTRLFLPG